MPKKTKNALSTNLQKTLPTADGGFGLVVAMLKAIRERRRMTVAKLSRLSGVAADAIERLEAGEFETARVRDLLLVSRVLKYHAGVALLPQRDKVPGTNEAVLKAFDRLMRSSKAVVFLHRQVDKELPSVTWDIVGDPDRNWLYVVATNRKRKVRFGKVTDDPGGWSIRGQLFGMDVETDAVARGLSDQIIKQHKNELT